MMSKKESSSGLNQNQLYLMRMLLQNAQPPKIETSPVQNIGDGIAQGVGNIVNALQYRRQQKQQADFLNSYLQQEQAAQQADALAQQQLNAKLAQQYGFDPSGMDASTINKQLEMRQQQQDQQNRANLVYQNQPTAPVVTGYGDQLPNLGIPQNQFDAQGNKVYGPTISPQQ